MIPAPLTCVVLAAGTSGRMGFDKVSARLSDGSTLLQRALHACSAHAIVLVISSQNTHHENARSDLRLVFNDAPERGMTHSLRLADAAIDPAHALAVLPADLPRIDAAFVERIVAAHIGVDVAYPVRPDGTPGHPVVFSPHARRLLADLPEGDTLRLLRDDARLTRRTALVTEDGPFVDVDEPADFYGL